MFLFGGLLLHMESKGDRNMPIGLKFGKELNEHFGRFIEPMSNDITLCLS